MGVIALDSNIFIRALDDPGPLGRKAIETLEDIKKTTSTVFISVMVLEEFFVKVYKEGKERDSKDILEFINMEGLVQLIDVNKEIALLAAKIRADFNIKAPDALHLASAIEAGAKTFITTDKRMPKKIGKLQIRILT